MQPHEPERRRSRNTLTSEWSLPEDVVYLNHGSFGPSPRAVREARQQWMERLESEPVDFFTRRMEDHLDEAASRLGAFLGTSAANLAFVENATNGMNVAAANTPLNPGDEVLLTDHEYGAVQRIWRHACRASGANLVVQNLPRPLRSAEEIVEHLFEAVTPRTRLLVVSHVTSPTAVVLPVEAICRRARERRIPVCVDGPHAPAMVPVNLDRLDCDFYTASCHKWLCAPFGTGFLYVAPRRQQDLQPVVRSWGGSVSGRPGHWKDEFTWPGTHDPSGYLAVPAAIDFLETFGIETFRRTTHELARHAQQRIGELTGLPPLVLDSREWYGSMVALPLPESRAEVSSQGHRDPLQDALWERYRIEVPVFRWHGRRLLRVSCHLYNSREDIDRLTVALSELLQ